MKNIIYKYYIIFVSLLSGIGMFSIASGISQKIETGGRLVGPGTVVSLRWDFDPIKIGIGAAFIAGAILLYKDARSKSK